MDFDYQLDLKFNRYHLLNGIYTPVKIDSHLLQFIQSFMNTDDFVLLNEGHVSLCILYKIFYRYIIKYNIRTQTTFKPDELMKKYFGQVFKDLKNKYEHFNEHNIQLFYINAILRPFYSKHVQDDLLNNLVKESHCVDHFLQNV